MTLLRDLGQIVGLDQTSAEFRRRIDGHNVPDPAPFLEGCQHILVDHPERSALILPPGSVIRGDLLLDHDNAQLIEAGIGTIACWGDLVIEGRLMNVDPEDGPFLLVAGNLTACEVVKGGACVIVLGSLTSPGVVFCDEQNGTLRVGGDVVCHALIDSDHDIYVAGRLDGIAIGDDLGNMRALLVPECFEDPDDPEDEWPLGDLIRQRLLSGLPVLK